MQTSLHSVLTDYLKGDQSYANIEKILNNINADNINKRVSAESNTIWELLEHIRITQEDILKYSLDPQWISPSWPEGHWPDRNIEASSEMMRSSVEQILSDYIKVCELAGNTSINLLSKIPHGEWRTYLREILLVIEHNAYHLGQLVFLRKYFNDWK